ncbi:MAG: histone deacetylase [Chloroflexia bacterium]
MSRDSNHGEQGVEIIYHPACLLHSTGQHPENASRIRAILPALARTGYPESALIRPEPAPFELLAQVHDPRYIATIEEIARSGGGHWDLDTYISPGSYEAAVLGAGAAVAAVDSVMGGARSAFALVRPPGHHALSRSAMGFCLFNNIAVAAQHAVTEHGLSRVLIVDWDIHHGNGTQDYFYSRPDILFFSIHRYPFYPGTGAPNETGAGKGQGYTVNVPLPAAVGDVGYNQVFEQVLVPLAMRYRPELILISAGYDAHIADPLGDASVSVAGFAQMALTVRQLADQIAECQGRVAAILEGGYNAEALAESVLATIAMLGSPTTPGYTQAQAGAPTLTRRSPDITSIIQQVRQLHRI